MGWRAGWALLAVATFIASAVACRQLVGIGEEPPVATGGAPDAGHEAGPPCGLEYAGAPCEACLEQQCCPQATACAGNPGCSALEGCLGACNGDVTCRAECTFTHRVSNSAEPTFAACLAAECTTACGLGCGSLALAFSGPDAAAGCANCVENQDQACSAANACVRDPDCQAIGWCTLTGQAEDRNEACTAEHDAGADAFGAVVGAVKSSCAVPCAFGNQWYCVGHPSPATQADPATTMTLFVYDLVTGRPVAGATVEVCAPLDPPCTTQMSDTTDDAGHVTMSVLKPPGTDYGVKGYLRVRATGLVDELYYWTFPLSEPTVGIQVGSLTSAELSALASPLPGVTLDSSRGSVGFATGDCDLEPAPGVQVALSPSDAETRIFYLENGAPDPGATSTDESGIGGAVNVETGVVSITVSPAGLAGPSTVFSGFVEPNTLTVFGLVPNQ